MYYRLKEPWGFCGWRKTPYAIQAYYGEYKHKKPIFIHKDIFMELLFCNGEEDVNFSDFHEKTQTTIQEMLKHGLMENSEKKMEPLKPWQRYHIFPSRQIDSVHWSITGKCNFNCRHCLVSAPDAHHPELPLADCLRIIREIASCGIKRVDVTGGEPLVRKDFEEIVKALSEYNIDIGVIFSNASLLNEELLRTLAKYGQYPGFQLSFDGLGQHDWLRGVPGAEKQADRAFKLLKELGVRVDCAMCIHKMNQDTLRPTIHYLADLGVRSLRVNAPQELGIWKQYADEYALSMDEVWEVYKQNIAWYFEDGMPIDLELDGFFKGNKGSTDYSVLYVHHPPDDPKWEKIPQCESMRHMIYIGADGRLAPCMAFADTVLKDTFPSVLEEHLGPLTLKSSYYDVVNTRMSEFLKANEECAACEFLKVCCGGCMVEGFAASGSCLSKDPHCCYFHKNIGEKAVREVADRAIAAFHPNS